MRVKYCFSTTVLDDRDVKLRLIRWAADTGNNLAVAVDLNYIAMAKGALVCA